MSIKISFVGDIMCELYTFRHLKKPYNFDSFFENMNQKMSESDYVVGNLETVFAGRNAKYTRDLYSFNTPDELADAMAKSKIDLVSTANNHCLDRGVEGLKRTLDILDSKRVSHTGTYRTKEEYDNIFVKDIQGVKIAFIACTGSTNLGSNGVVLSGEDRYCLDFTNSQDMRYYKNVNPRKFAGLTKFFTAEQKFVLKKMLGNSTSQMKLDVQYDEERMKPYLTEINRKIEEARQFADFVFVLPHIGGQFNKTSGPYVKYIMETLCIAGADAIIATHPHVVQKMELQGSVPVAYCIGNYSMSPNSVYLVHENKPEYSIMLHLYIDEKRIEKISYSVIKMVEEEQLTVYPVEVLAKQLTGERLSEIKKDVAFICRSFSCSDIDDDLEIQSEYIFKE